MRQEIGSSFASDADVHKYANTQIQKKHKDSSTQIQNDKKPIVLPWEKKYVPHLHRKIQPVWHWDIWKHTVEKRLCIVMRQEMGSLFPSDGNAYIYANTQTQRYTNTHTQIHNDKKPIVLLWDKKWVPH